MSLNLGALTDEQQAKLTNLAYVNFDGMDNSFSEFLDDGQELTLNDIIIERKKEILETYGDLKKLDPLTKEQERVKNELGKINYILEDLDDLGNLKIVDLPRNNNNESGFVGWVFEDDFGNRGMSLRGTEEGLFGKDMLDNISTMVTGDSKQRKDAQAFFDEYKNPDGNNFLFGHSKGGELVTSLLLDNGDEVAHTFVVNPQPVNPYQAKNLKLLYSEKYEAIIVEGDIVSFLGLNIYLPNVRYVNNGGSWWGSHSVASLMFDENGNLLNYDFKISNVFKYLIQNSLGVIATALLTGVQTAYARVEKLVKVTIALYDSIVNNIILPVAEFVNKVVEFIGDKSREFKEFVSNIYTVVKDSIKSIYKKLFGNKVVAKATPEIQVDTEHLRDLADRLQQVNNRIDQLDSDLNYLYFTEPLASVKSLLKANLLLPSDKKIKGCIKYLNGTAEAFDNAEKNIKAFV